MGVVVLAKADSGLYAPGSLGRHLVLPYPDDDPPCGREGDIVAAIASDIPVELLTPPLAVGLGCLTMQRTAVPEASVDEHRDTSTCEDDIGSHEHRVNHEAEVLAEPEPAGVQDRPETELGSGVRSAVGLHSALRHIAARWR